MGESHNPAAFFCRCGNACGLSREKVTLRAEFIHGHSNIHDIVHVQLIIFWYNLDTDSIIIHQCIVVLQAPALV